MTAPTQADLDRAAIERYTRLAVRQMLRSRKRLDPMTVVGALVQTAVDTAAEHGHTVAEIAAYLRTTADNLERHVGRLTS